MHFIKHLFFFTLFTGILSTTGFAQALTTLKGKLVSEESQTDLAGATISLLNTADSTIIKNTTSIKDGSFELKNVAEGNYMLSVTHTAFHKTYSKPFTVKANDVAVNLPPLPLNALSKTLAGVTVTGKKSFIEHKVDRTVINVDASITNAGTTAWEVLENAPGVIVDKDGNISLKGKEGVLIMIDGRPAQLGGADLANYLRGMSSNQLDQIEIMTNPPARFDASGTAGVINIKTKKNKAAGYNGAFTLGYGQGRYPKANEGFNFNYRKDKINFFTNLSHNFNKGYEIITINRKIKDENTYVVQNLFDQEASQVRTGNSLNGKIGMDFIPSQKTNFGFVLSGYNSHFENNSSNETYIYSPSKEMESRTGALVINNNNWKSFSTNLNYRTVFDSTGQELTADLDYIEYGSKQRLSMNNSYFDINGNPSAKADTLFGSLPQDINIYSGRLDYTLPLKKKGARFEAGLKSSIVKTDNNASYDSLQYGQIIHDYNRSNHFIYEENINAAYANLSTPLTKKISAQFGLRLENTNAKGKQLTTGQNFDRHYTQLFPTAYFQYKVNENNNFGLNYGRRIQRPNYERLNPFIRFIDRYTYSEGNPDLKPQFSHQVEVSHSYKNKLITTFNYSKTVDIIQNTIEQKGRIAYAKHANIATLRQYGLSINANNNLTQWWTSNVNVNIYNNLFEGEVNNTPISLSSTRVLFTSTQQFKLTKTLSAELNGIYRSGGVQGVGIMKDIGMLSAGFSQLVMKNKGTLKLSVRDIFHTIQPSININYGNVDVAIKESNDTRVVNLSFSYRFSKGKLTPVKKKSNGSAADEQNRVGVN